MIKGRKFASEVLDLRGKNQHPSGKAMNLDQE